MNEIKLALTSGEWASRGKRFYRNELHEKSLDIIAPEWGVAFVQTRVKREGVGLEFFRIAAESPEERHAMAAFCLDAQAFGFTWEDVGILRTMAGELTHAASDYPEVVAAYPSDFASRMTSIADRIEALLPPPETP